MMIVSFRFVDVVGEMRFLSSYVGVCGQNVVKWLLFYCWCSIVVQGWKGEDNLKINIVG